MNFWIKITRQMQSLTFSLLKKFLLKVQSSTLTLYSQQYPQKMHMTHCPARVRDPSRIMFYKNFVPSSNFHSPLILIKTKRSPFFNIQVYNLSQL